MRNGNGSTTDMALLGVSDDRSRDQNGYTAQESTSPEWDNAWHIVCHIIDSLKPKYDFTGVSVHDPEPWLADD